MTDDDPLVVDGAAGGGQLLRTALSLATLTGTAFRMENVRANRPKPGLRPQHLAAVELLADLSEASVDGAEVGAETVTFRPGDARQTPLSADIPTAGSVTLLFDAALPVAATYDVPFSLTATGGTDVKWAPTLAYLRHVKLPLLAAAGLDAAVDRRAVGFYPAGGGEARLRVEPSALSPLDLTERGDLDRVEIRSTASESLAGAEVADRQATQAEARLDEAGLAPDVCRVEYVETRSPGSSLLCSGVYDRSRLGASELGERGVPSETVADRAVDRFLDSHDGPGAVDPHMADQLTTMLAVTGGRVRVPAVTDHVETNREVLRAFGCDVRLDRAPGGGWLLDAAPHPAVE
jgi:RNA 3'-terminal phosphate cyclase (ATP)